MDHLSVPEGYQPFPSVEWRSTLQQDREVPALVRALGLMQGQHMLEVGCGRGVALESFARLCCPARLVGLDLDADALAQASQQLTTRSIAATLVQGDMRALPFEDGSFDVVIDFGTCYHISRPGAALVEITRVLSFGGLLVHETRIAQLLAHPIRSCHNQLPWESVPTLTSHQTHVLWASRQKRSDQ